MTIFGYSQAELVQRVKGLYIQTEDWFLDLTFELAHDYLFLTSHFPIFFILHAFWICVVVRRCGDRLKWWESYVVAGLMTLLGRVLIACITGRRCPVFDNVLYIPAYSAIWLVVNCCPFDCVYSVLNSRPIAAIAQFAFALVQVRETCHGVDIGLRAFPSGTGAILIAVMLSSTESFVWLLFGQEPTREFSNQAVLRNLFCALLYFGLTQYPEKTPSWVESSKEGVKIWALIAYLGLVLIEMVIFWEIRGRKGIDITLLSYVGKALSYTGNKEIKT
jgi:hypothetical protein